MICSFSMSTEALTSGCSLSDWATAFITKAIIVSLMFGADVVGQAALANPLQLGDVGVVEVGDVRNRRRPSGPC